MFRSVCWDVTNNSVLALAPIVELDTASHRVILEVEPTCFIQTQFCAPVHSNTIIAYIYTDIPVAFNPERSYTL
jgi:hypothetical protein